MVWIAPKLDWLPSDSINAVDFNRIENNTKEVVDYLNSIQYAMPTLTYNMSRTVSSVEFLSSINRIERNIDTIRANFVTPPEYGGAKTWTVGKGFDYSDATRLEQNIKFLMDYGILAKNFRICGAYTCGEEGRLY